MRRLLIALLLLLIASSVAADETPVPEPTAEAIPEAMPLVSEGDYDIINILLMGSATTNSDNPGLTDSLMIVSVNRTVGAVSVVSIPRDLYVYIPGFDMQKINTAFFYGETRAVEGGGYRLLMDTIEYNLGLKIDFYARINFNGFEQIIDSVGGIDLTVDCVIRDWKLKSPELDKQVAENYEMFTLGIGRWTLDGDLALWYVRSRKTSSDFDRGRRQQDVLRALWRKVRAGNMLAQLPQTWDALTRSVTTNLTLTDAASMAPLVANMQTSDIQYYRFHLKQEVIGDYSPAGQAVLVPQREAIISLMQQVVLPPTANQVKPVLPLVAVINAGGVPDLEYVAADRLELEGFRTFVTTEDYIQFRRYNHIVDLTGATKGNPIGTIQKVLRVTDEGVEIAPDASREVDYKVYIGSQYQYWSCTRDVIQPPFEDDATATPESGG